MVTFKRYPPALTPDDFNKEQAYLEAVCNGFAPLGPTVLYVSSNDPNLDKNSVDDGANPRQSPTEAWEGFGGATPVITEQSDFKINDNLYWRWYRGGHPATKIGFATSVDGITWTPDAGNPISFAPTIADGSTMFPYVVKDGATFYMFLQNQANNKVYLFDVTDPLHPVVLNGGAAVLEATEAWEGGIIYNVAVAIVGATWHMIYEAGPGYMQFHAGYTHSTIAAMNWTANKSANNPIMPYTGNPDLLYVPDRNALLMISGKGELTDMWSIWATYAYLTDDLDLAASWHRGQLLHTSTVHETDPSILVGMAHPNNIMMAWGYDQIYIYQSYWDLTLNEFFDVCKQTNEITLSGGMAWLDSATGIIWRRNAANDAWNVEFDPNFQSIYKGVYTLTHLATSQGRPRLTLRGYDPQIWQIKTDLTRDALWAIKNGADDMLLELRSGGTLSGLGNRIWGETALPFSIGTNDTLRMNIAATGATTFYQKIATQGYTNTAMSVSQANPWLGTATGTRALDTVYQNLTDQTIIVYVSAIITGNAVASTNYFNVSIGTDNPPTTNIGVTSNATIDKYVTQTFIVPNDYYYKVPTTGTVTLYKWTEQFL